MVRRFGCPSRFQTLGGWRREQYKHGKPLLPRRAAGGCQSNNLADPDPIRAGHQRPADHPKSIDSSNSFPRMTCQAALASLHANAFMATGTLRRRFLRSYQAAIFG